jgi:hypothetical protein
MVPQMEAEGLEVGHQTHIRFFTAEECAYKMNTKMMEKQTRNRKNNNSTEKTANKNLKKRKLQCILRLHLNHECI